MSKLTDILAGTGGILGILGIIALVVVVLCILPALFLWSVNSLAELGGSNFYIAHSVWSYFVSFIFLCCVKSTVANKG